MANPKETWPVIRFIVAGTGLGPKLAREMLAGIEEAHYSQLFLGARKWDQETNARASELLTEIVSSHSLETLVSATRRAQYPSTHRAHQQEPLRQEPDRLRKRRRAS